MWWVVFLIFVAFLVTCVLLVLCVYHTYRRAKAVFFPAIQLPAHLREVWVWSLGHAHSRVAGV